MSEWKEYKLVEVADISTGYAFKGDEYEFKGKLRVVRGENVTIGNLRWDSEKYWNKSTDNLGQYFLEENDIVIGMDGSRVGHNRAKIKSQELPLILAQRVAKLRAKNNFDQSFLWYHIFSDNFKDYVEAIHTGTSIPHISQRQIADFEILAPKLKTEQAAIASVLSSLDDKIDLLHRQNATLEKMAETLFRQWFVEEAKEDWVMGKLGDIAEIQNGFAFSSKDYVEFQNGHLEVLKMGHIQKGGGLRTNPKKDYVPRSERLNKWVLKKGDIIMAMTDMKDNVVILGVPAMIDKDDKYVLNQRVARLTLKSNDKLINNYLLYVQLMDSEFIAILQSKANSGVQVNLSTEAIKDCDIIIPPRAVQNDVGNTITNLYLKKENNDIQIQTLTIMRNNLLPKFMNGDITVDI